MADLRDGGGLEKEELHLLDPFFPFFLWSNDFAFKRDKQGRGEGFRKDESGGFSPYHMYRRIIFSLYLLRFDQHRLSQFPTSVSSLLSVGMLCNPNRLSRWPCSSRMTLMCEETSICTFS